MRKRDDATGDAASRSRSSDRKLSSSFCDVREPLLRKRKNSLRLSFPPLPSSFVRPFLFLLLSRVCVQQIGGGCRGGFCANNVRPFGGFPNFSLLLTMKNVSRYSKNWLRPLPRKQGSITIHKNRVHIMNDCYKVFSPSQSSLLSFSPHFEHDRLYKLRPPLKL